MIVIDVLGTPAPKGSAQAFVNKRTGRAVLVPGGARSTRERMLEWDQVVREAIMAQVFGGDRDRLPEVAMFVEKPLRVGMVFRLKRPRAHFHRKTGALLPTAPIVHINTPDGDKLARATNDALKGTVIDDDSRIVELGVVKIYAAPGREGARITIEEWRPHAG